MAEDAKCSQCKDACPQLKCYCMEIPISLCSACAVVHFLADPDLPHRPFPVGNAKAGETCEVCRISHAEKICTCMFPWISYCGDCAQIHLSSDAAEMKHTLEPISAKFFLQSAADLPEYYARQEFVEALHAEVLRNTAQVDAAIAEVNKVAYDLMTTIEGWRANLISAFEKIKLTVNESVQICTGQLDNLRYEPIINPTMRIDQLVQLGTKDSLRQALEEMKMLHWTVDTEKVTKQLPFIFSYHDNYMMLDAVEKLYFAVPKTNTMVTFALPDMTPIDLRLDTDFRFKSFSAWCKISTGQVVLTGGLSQKDGSKYYKDTIWIDPSTKKTREMTPMKKERCRHGTLCHQGYVYVFGGYSDEYLKSCERFDLKENNWSSLPDLKDARDCVTAAAWKDRIYIVGYASNKVEIFDVGSGNMFVMPITLRPTVMNLLVPKHCALVCIENGEMTMVMENEIIRVNIEGQTVRNVKLPVKVEKSWYSPCPPAIQHTEAAYLFTLEGELWKLDLRSSTLHFVHKHK